MQICQTASRFIRDLIRLVFVCICKTVMYVFRRNGIDDHYLYLVLAYILLVLYTQPAGNNGHLREFQIRICKKLLTRCAVALQCCAIIHRHFSCCVFTYHSYAMLRLLFAGLSPRRSGFNPIAVVLGFVVDRVALRSLAFSSQ